MAHKLSEIKGIDPAVQKKLEAMGIGTVEKLMEQTSTPAECMALAEEVGIPASQLTELVNRADLMRLKGVGMELANLLEECGVDTVNDLRHRNAESLHAQLAQTNAHQQLTHHVPSVAQIQGWIDTAQEMAAQG